MDCLKEVLMVLSISFVAGEIRVFLRHKPTELESEFEDLPADFGSLLPTSGLSVLAVYAKPPDACSEIDKPPFIDSPIKLWAVVIRRYNCTYEEKILNAQQAGFHVAIVHNVNSSELVKMGVDHPERIDIPSLFVSNFTGMALKNYAYDKGYFLRIDDPSRDFDFRLMIPSIVVIILSVVAMIGFMISKWINYRRRNRRRRLPHSSLAQIPTAKFRKGDPYETCAICLDDFTEGEKLRILPCSHAYHCTCIDPWLTRNRRVCPMCKRKVFAQDEIVESDDSLSDDDDDNTPLLRGSNSNSNVASETTRESAYEIMNRIRDLITSVEGTQPPRTTASGSSPSVASTHSTSS